MGRLDGTVALITGGAKGQGRSHALTLAREGANIALVDNCEESVEGQFYPGGSKEDLAKTQAMVTELGRECLTFIADVRNEDDMEKAAKATVEQLGQIDFLLCSAGTIRNYGKLHQISSEQFRAVVETNLTGVFLSCKAVLPYMVERRKGVIVITASTGGRAGVPNISDYVASKWGVIGMMKSIANEYGEYGIRANCVAPSNVNSGDRPSMTNNQETFELFCPDLDSPTREDAIGRMKTMHPLGVEGVDPEDISNAILFLLSDDARYISGEVTHVTAGLIANNTA